MLNRRHLLASAAATVTSLSLPKFVLPSLAQTGDAAKLNALMTVFFEE
jgi:hypothetical protein